MEERGDDSAHRGQSQPTSVFVWQQEKKQTPEFLPRDTWSMITFDISQKPAGKVCWLCVVGQPSVVPPELCFCIAAVFAIQYCCRWNNVWEYVASCFQTSCMCTLLVFSLMRRIKEIICIPCVAGYLKLLLGRRLVKTPE